MWKQRFSTIEQSHDLFHRRWAVNSESDIHSGVWLRPNKLVAALRFVTYLYMNHITLTFFNNTLYTMQVGWTGSVLCTLLKNQLQAVFQSNPSPVSIALGFTRPSPSATVVILAESVAPGMFNMNVMVAEELPAFDHAPNMTSAVPMSEREQAEHDSVVAPSDGALTVQLKL